MGAGSPDLLPTGPGDGVTHGMQGARPKPAHHPLPRRAASALRDEGYPKAGNVDAQLPHGDV